MKKSASLIDQPKDKLFYETFLLATIIVLLPSRALGYIVPFICLLWYVIRGHSGKVFRLIILSALVFLLVIFFYWSIYSYVGINFLVSNSIVSLITHGSLLFILLVRGSFITSNYSYDKFATVLNYAVLIQGLVGIVQFLAVSLTNRFDILPGDAVQGTIGLFAFVSGVAGFGNQMFAINMVFFLVFLAPSVLKNRKRLLSFSIGLISLMFAGVLHVFIALIFSTLVTLFLFRKNLVFSNLGKLVVAVILAGLLILPLGTIFPDVFKTANVFITLYQNLDSPKFHIVDRTVNDMTKEYPYVYLIGLGPGQYLSRAGLMSSGKYLDRPIPLLSNTMSEPFQKYAFQTWNSYSTNSDRFGASTMHRPYFSMLSIFAEFGLVGLLLLLTYLIILMARMRKTYLYYRRNHENQSAYLCFATGLLLIFLFSISFFDNYLETTQAIFPGLLLLSAFYRYLRERASLRASFVAQPHANQLA